MPPITNSIQQAPSGFRSMPSVPALFRPGLNNIPIRSEIRLLAGLLDARVIKPRNPDQFPQIMRMAGLYFLLIGELVSLSSLCDACFERTPRHSQPCNTRHRTAPC